jgi:hypothetical protein
MSRTHALIIALVLLLAGGIMHGLSAERWRSSVVLEDAAARLDEVPKEFGDWQSRDEASDEEAFDQAGARRYWTRTYSHRRTKDHVRVILMCGRAGRMAVHTPQMCYRGAGYEMPEDATRYNVDTGGDKPAGSFWTATFTKPAGLSSDLRLFWAWDTRGPWEAAENPRWQFRGEPFLYKLYVAHDLTGQSDSGPAADVAAKFLREFLPELGKALFPPIASVN